MTPTEPTEHTEGEGEAGELGAEGERVASPDELERGDSEADANEHSNESGDTPEDPMP